MHNSAQIIDVDPANPEQKTMQRAGKILEQNGLVIFPATCIYGVAANALDNTAIKKIFELKQRPKNNPILVLIPCVECLKELVQSIPQQAEKLMSAFWPGKITLVFNAKNKVSSLLTADTGKIGIRWPAHPVAQALLNSVDFPITGTSANLSGQNSCATTRQLPQSIIDQADLILNAKALKGGMGSSIVDVTTTPATIIRQGQISADQIKNILKN
ncbi:MAG: threonylcarbamoyl-AMP synthase [Desulfobacula sp.]|nr:threonylcarbamoyl-AMP synthase [Desulfobacula sp.]